MFILIVLIFTSCLSAPALQATMERQKFKHSSDIHRNLDNDEPQAKVTDHNIAFDLPDITAIIKTQSGSVQLEGFKYVNNDKLLVGMTTSQLFWVSIGYPQFFKTKSPTNSSDYRFFHSSKTGVTTYVQMMTEEQRAALAAAARNKYQADIDDRQVVSLILSKFYCNIMLYDEAGSKYLLSGNISDFRKFPLRMDFDALPGKIERILFSELINESEDDLSFDCHIESSGGKLIKSNTLSISYEESQKIGIEEKLFGKATNTTPNEMYVTRNQMFELAHEMYSTLNIIEEYEIPEAQFSEAFVNELVSQVATSQFSQTPIDSVLASISKYSFDTSADLRPDTIKKDFGSFLTINQIGEKSRIVFNEKKHKDVSGTYGGSIGGGVTAGPFSASGQFAFEMSKRNITTESTATDQLRELNRYTQNEAQWKIEGDKVVPKSLNVARIMRSNMKKSLTFNRIRLQQFNAPFRRNFKIYTSRSSKLLCQNVSTPKVCPYGFDYFPEINQCLYLNLYRHSWGNARNSCEEIKTGAHMVSIKYPAKQEVVRRFLQYQFSKKDSAVCASAAWPAGGKMAWLGGQTKDPKKCGTPYVWKSMGVPETPFKYTNWHMGMPLCSGEAQNCPVIASAPEVNYGWRDMHCYHLLCSVCEF